MSMTRLKVRSGMTLTEYMECVGPSVRRFVIHLPGWRPITVDSHEALLGGSTHLLGRPTTGCARTCRSTNRLDSDCGVMV